MINHKNVGDAKSDNIIEVYGGTVVEDNSVMYLFADTYDLVIDALDYYADVIEYGYDYGEFLDWMASFGVYDVLEEDCRLIDDDLLYDESRDLTFKFTLVAGYTVE